jgi:DNA-binding transcriptional MerR regulator
MTYSISDLEQLSGVQTHTIRIWERRYQALEPIRSAGNTRLYDDNQLRRLLNIVSLSQSGLKISYVCSLSESEMNEILTEGLSKSGRGLKNYEYYISQLLSVGLAYEEFEFDKIITKAIKEYGLKETYINIMYPLLVRLGLMWRSDNICPAQEHFLSNIIKQKISLATAAIKQKTPSKSTWILFLPEDEDHDIGLLFANYLLRQAGQKVIYLGSKVPLLSLQDVIGRLKVDHLLLFMTRSRSISATNVYLKELTKSCIKQIIHIAGNPKLIGDVDEITNLRWMKSIGDLEEQIKIIDNVI